MRDFGDLDNTNDGFWKLDSSPHTLRGYPPYMEYAAERFLCLATPCQPDRDTQKHDNCLGDDQCLYSAIINEQNHAGAMAARDWMHSDLVESLFFDKEGKNFHQGLEYGFCRVLTGEEIIGDVFTETVEKQSLVLTESEINWDSDDNKISELLFSSGEAIMKVDWRDDSFPTRVPQGLAYLERDDQKS